jgi:WD40 repeat protein
MYNVESIEGNCVNVFNLNTNELYWKCKVTGIKKVTGAAITNEDLLVVTGESGKSKMYNLKTRKIIKIIHDSV